MFIEGVQSFLPGCFRMYNSTRENMSVVAYVEGIIDIYLSGILSREK